MRTSVVRFVSVERQTCWRERSSNSSTMGALATSIACGKLLISYKEAKQ